jgi:hypothetical protein
MQIKEWIVRRAIGAVIACVSVGVLIGAGPAFSQNGPKNEVTIGGELPRTSQGLVDTAQIREFVTSRVSQGAREVVFRGFTLSADEARSLLLSAEANQNLLRQLGDVLPADGVEREIALRGLAGGNSIDARVHRTEEGLLRARLEGVSVGAVSADERAQLVRNLAAQSGFERVRLQGVDESGQAIRVEFRVDKGIVKNEIRNSGSGGGDSGHRGGRGDQAVLGSNDRRQDRQEEDRRADRQADRREDRQADRQTDRRGDRQADRRVDQLERAVSVDRSQRPERPERLQRADRPERSGRSGR